MTVRASANERARRIYAILGTTSYLLLALVYVHAILLVLTELVTHGTATEMATYRVGAFVRTTAVTLETLVYVQTRGSVAMQIMSLVTGTYVTTEKIRTVVRAIVFPRKALVHVYATLLVLRHENVTGRTLAMIPALRVNALMRTTGVNVVLEFLAFVDVLAS